MRLDEDVRFIYRPIQMLSGSYENIVRKIQPHHHVCCLRSPDLIRRMHQANFRNKRQDRARWNPGNALSTHHPPAESRPSLKIALIAPPFIAVPPADYGGTELFVANLAEGLTKAGIEVIVYANGESTVSAELRSIYEHSQWPIKVPEHAWIRELDHNSWATKDAAKTCDIIHFQSAQGIAFSRFVDRKIVL